MMQKLVQLVLVASLLVGMFPMTVYADEVPGLHIVEVKLGGVIEGQLTEYVSIYNSTSTALTLDEHSLYLDYAKPSTELERCTDGLLWSAKPVTGKLVGTIEPFSVLTFPLNMNDDVGGIVRLVEATEAGLVAEIYDMVAWGSNDKPAPCAASNVAVIPVKKNSLQRYLVCDSLLPQITGNSMVDFILSSLPTPGQLPLAYPPQCMPDPEEPEDPDGFPGVSCEGVILSEVLPNAAGSDTGREFIEIHNPTDEVIEMNGCSLQLQGSNKMFLFTGQVLAPGDYLALFDDVTGITLPNAGGGTIWLVSANNIEIDTIAYPPAMPDDTAWALVDGAWQLTYMPSPNSSNIAQPHKPCGENQIRDETTLQCRSSTSSQTSSLTPCREGQERNPETNRCRAIASSNALVPCKEGQERNPETNRCRSVLGANTSLVPCKAGEERNPETNRCRKIASSSLTPCKEGQERNPETNRCRKITKASSGIADVKDIESNTSASKTSWLITGAVVFAAIAYAVYEWRQDIKQRIRRLRRR